MQEAFITGIMGIETLFQKLINFNFCEVGSHIILVRLVRTEVRLLRTEDDSAKSASSVN